MTDWDQPRVDRQEKETDSPAPESRVDSPLLSFCIFVTTTTQIQTFIVYYVCTVETHRADVFFFASQVFFPGLSTVFPD